MKFFKKWFRSSVKRKISLSFLLVLTFMLGRHIPVPYVLVSDYLFKNDSFFGLSTSALGGDLSRISLFSLGLGPWMYTLILLRLSRLGKKKQSSPKSDTIKRNLLMLLIASVQSLSIVVNIDFVGAGPHWLLMLEAMLVLIAGAFILSWLGSMNSHFGLGGPTVLVLVSMLDSQINALLSSAKLFSSRHSWLILIIFIWSFLAVFVYLTFERGEYRIPLKRVSINSQLITETYLPIKVNSASGMQMMYAFSFMLLPQYGLLIWQYFNPHNSQLTKWESYFSTSSLVGILIYMGIVFSLTLVFSFVNIDLTRTVEDLRKSGDYIPNIRPGRDTKVYIKKVILILSIFSGVIISLMLALPLFIALKYKDLTRLALLTGILMMSSAMICLIREEVKTIQLKKQYTPLFK